MASLISLAKFPLLTHPVKKPATVNSNTRAFIRKSPLNLGSLHYFPYFMEMQAEYISLFLTILINFFKNTLKKFLPRPEKEYMIKILTLLTLFLVASCGESGQIGDENSLSLGSGGSDIPNQFLSQICGGGSPEFYKKFKIEHTAGGGRLAGSLVEGQFQGQTQRKFVGIRGSDAILYIEEKGEELFNVAVALCDAPPGSPRNFSIEAVGLSTKTTRCPPFEDINYGTLTFYREAPIHPYGYGLRPDEITFSAAYCN